MVSKNNNFFLGFAFVILIGVLDFLALKYFSRSGVSYFYLGIAFQLVCALWLKWKGLFYVFFGLLFGGILQNGIISEVTIFLALVSCVSLIFPIIFFDKFKLNYNLKKCLDVFGFFTCVVVMTFVSAFLSILLLNFYSLIPVEKVAEAFLIWVLCDIGIGFIFGYGILKYFSKDIEKFL